jgi:hypothetical protein
MLQKAILPTVLFALGALGTAAIAVGQNSPRPGPLPCGQVSLARPEHGVAYTGLVQNSDYRFSATIPERTTGWGAGLSAPFHGFTIFLDEDMRSTCIVFQIGLRVVLPEDKWEASRRQVASKSVKVGNLTGMETRIIGSIDGVGFENRIVSVELHRGIDTDDLMIMLVTPAADRGKAERVFDAFLGRLKFW